MNHKDIIDAGYRLSASLKKLEGFEREDYEAVKTGTKIRDLEGRAVYYFDGDNWFVCTCDVGCPIESDDYVHIVVKRGVEAPKKVVLE